MFCEKGAQLRGMGNHKLMRKKKKLAIKQTDKCPQLGNSKLVI